MGDGPRANTSSAPCDRACTINDRHSTDAVFAHDAGGFVVAANEGCRAQTSDGEGFGAAVTAHKQDNGLAPRFGQSLDRGRERRIDVVALNEQTADRCEGGFIFHACSEGDVEPALFLLLGAQPLQHRERRASRHRHKDDHRRQVRSDPGGQPLGAEDLLHKLRAGRGNRKDAHKGNDANHEGAAHAKDKSAKQDRDEQGRWPCRRQVRPRREQCRDQL